jgi:cytochrome P450
MTHLFAIFGPFFSFGAFIFYRTITIIALSFHNSRRARELKCQDPPTFKTYLPFGLDIVNRAMAADRAMRFPTDLVQRVEEVGACTHLYSAMGSTNLFTADEKNIQAMLATKFIDYDVGKVRRGNFMPLLGCGIFTQDGEQWEHSRAIMRPQFKRDQVSNFDLLEQHVQNIMKAIRPDPDRWTGKVELQVLFFRLTLDSATQFLFGESVDSQLMGIPGYSKPASFNSSQDEKTFASAFDQGQMFLATRSRLQSKYWLYCPKKFQQACRDCHAFIDHFVRLALSEEQGIRKSDEKKRYIFLEALASQTQDPLELRSQLLHILLAGRDTTASLMGWLFFELARNQRCYEKLRKVVLDNFGTFEDPTDITFETLKSCKYLQYCVNETLRLYPAVPVNSRMANKDTTLPRGGGTDGKSPIFIPKGRSCYYSVFVMHRRKDLWGENADDFWPERWENRKRGWEFLPVSSPPPTGMVNTNVDDGVVQRRTP